MKLTDIYWYIRSDISKIEKELERSIDADHPILMEASTHLLRAGGKRIRPVFVLLASKFGDYNLDEAKKVAVPLELIHMGSLVHDDVIDDAELRRGKKTVKAAWDNRVAMYTGDYIFGKAIEIATKCKAKEIHPHLANVMVQICVGEIDQIRDQYDWNQNLKIYFRRIKRKTALLLAVSCQLGAMAANAPKSFVKSLYQFGYFVGMAYQITDDILDFVGTEKQLGKPAGSDLMQGNVTLPALYALEHHPHIREKIIDFLEEKNSTNKEDITEIIQLIKSSGAVEYSKELADKYLRKAKNALIDLPECQAKSSLLQIADYIGERQF